MPGRKPSTVLSINGAFKKNPARARKREPDSGKGIGPAPEHLTDAERAVWDEIVGDCAPGVFQSSDRVMLASLCRLESELRADPVGFGGRKWMVWRSLVAACGMSPADRSRISVPDGDGKDKPKTGLARFL